MAITIRDVVQENKKSLQLKETARNVIRGILVSVSGSVVVSGRPNYVYFLEYGQLENSPPSVVFNDTVSPIDNLPVLVTTDPTTPYKRKVIGVYHDGMPDNINGGVGLFSIPTHAVTHEWPTEFNPGHDKLYVYQPALQQLKSSTNNNLIITVNPLIYVSGNSKVYFPGASIDVSSYLPSTGNVKKILLYLNTDTNTVDIVDGTEVIPPVVPPLPFIPDNGIPSVFVQLNDSVTNLLMTDLEDARSFLSSNNNLSVFALDDLTDVTITTPVDGDFLRYDSGTGEWVNEFVPIPDSLNDLTDVTITTPILGDVLVYTGSQWENQPVSSSDVHEVNDTATNSVSNAVTIRHITSNTPTTGFGVSMQLELENNSNVNIPVFNWSAMWTDTGTSEVGLIGNFNIAGVLNPVVQIFPTTTSYTPSGNIGAGSIELCTFRGESTQYTSGTQSIFIGGNASVKSNNSIVIGHLPVDIDGVSNNQTILNSQITVQASHSITAIGSTNINCITSYGNTILQSSRTYLTNSQNNIVLNNNSSVITDCNYNILARCGNATTSNYNVAFTGTLVASSYNFIGTGTNHSIGYTLSSFIGSGNTNTIGGGSYSGIIAGNTNQIVSSRMAVIDNGEGNNIQYSDFPAIFNGRTNRILSGGSYSTIINGDHHLTNSSHSTILSGVFGYSTLPGQILSSTPSPFDTISGSAQGTIQVISNREITHSTTNWEEIYLNGLSNQFIVPKDGAWTFETKVIGAEQALTSRFAYKIVGTVHSDGTTAVIDAFTVTTIFESNPIFDARVSVSGSSLLIEVRSSFATSDTIRWVATTSIAELVWS